MKEDPDVVCLYIPLMKELHMDWAEIQSLPKSELHGILKAFNSYELMHAFDGHSKQDINEMAKNDSSVRSRYAESMTIREKFERRMGIKNTPKKDTFSDLLG